MSDPKCAAAKLIVKLYTDEYHGYELVQSEIKHMGVPKSSLTYGEIMPAATQHLLDHLKLKHNDVLYDLGSGVGKFIIQAAMTFKTKKMRGIELAPSRHHIAEQRLTLSRKQNWLKTSNVKFECMDILKTNLSEVTVVYTCSTAFPAGFMKLLTRHVATAKKGLRFISLQELPENPYFEKIEDLRLDMSWKRKEKVHIYYLKNPL